MPNVRCGKRTCEYHQGGVCTQSYIYLDPVDGEGNVKCMSFKMDREFESVLTVLAQNPKLSRGE